MVNKKIMFCLTIVTIILIPTINANTVSNTTEEDELIDISVEICRIDQSQEKIVQLNQKDSHKLETIFDDMKKKLDNVNTNRKTVEIFNEVVEYLHELELLPKDMSIKETQQLVNNINYNENILSNDNENFNCYIYGKTSWTTFIQPGREIWPSNLKLLLILLNGSIALGEECWDWNGGSGDYHKEPASGWIWTKGSNGVKIWEGDSLWGNLGAHLYEYEFATIRYKYLFYKGATGFTGIRIRRPLADWLYFFGTASHVSIVTEFPGKSPPKEIPNSEPTTYLHDLFLFGKVFNVIMGGYTPAYWFHIDKVTVIEKQDPKVQWLKDCDAHMLSMDFRGFVFKNTIIGHTKELLIY